MPPKRALPSSDSAARKERKVADALDYTPHGMQLAAQLVFSPLCTQRTRIVTLSDMLKMNPRRLANVFTRRTGYAVRPCACGSARCPVLVETHSTRPSPLCVCRRRIYTGVPHETTLLTKTLTLRNEPKPCVVAVATCARDECVQQVESAMQAALPRRGLP